MSATDTLGFVVVFIGTPLSSPSLSVMMSQHSSGKVHILHLEVLKHIWINSTRKGVCLAKISLVAPVNPGYLNSENIQRQYCIGALSVETCCITVATMVGQPSLVPRPSSRAVDPLPQKLSERKA